MLPRALLHHRQFRYLGAFYLHSVTRLFAVSIFQIFTSLYIYQTLLSFKFSSAQALASTSLLFALIYLVQALGTGPGLWLISKKGLRMNVFWGSIALVLYFLLLYLGKFDPIFFVLAAIASGVQISLYWTSYHIYFVELSDDKKQGQELSFSSFLSAIASIGGPAFGGLVITYGGYNAAFIAMAMMMALAVWPLRFLPQQKNNIEINILKVINTLSPKRELKSFLALGGMAITDITNELFWPLFAFSILAGFVGLGFMGSLVAFTSAIATIGIGWLIDKYGPKRVIRIFSPFSSIIWVLRTLVMLPSHVFFVSTAYALTLDGQGMSIDTEIYERARHTDIVAFIVQREMGLSLSKFIFLLLVGILFWFGLPLVAVFILAAICTLFAGFYPFEEKQSHLT
jgi:MFS transporter, DHA1 family, inner membrane transport protein